jgi:hypothetical protein
VAAILLCGWLGFYAAPGFLGSGSVEAQNTKKQKSAPQPAKTQPAAKPAQAPPPQKPHSAARKAAAPPPTRSPVARDWEKFPAIVERHTSGDIAAVGDVHGDFNRLAKLLAVAKLIADVPATPDQVRWTGSQTVLVCTGDLIDKGDHSLDVLACFRALQKQASDAGGAVIVTMGNHEAEFLSHPTDDKKAAEFVRELVRAQISPKDVADGKDKLGVGTFLRDLPLAAKVDDWFFAHACSTQGKKLSALDHQLRERVSKVGFGVSELLGPHGLLEARLHPIPWWEKEKDKPEESEARLRKNADALTIQHFVMGHQPETVHFSDGSKRKRGEMVQKFDGLIFLIDVGMSKAINYSEGVMLMIHRGSDGEVASALDSKQNRTPLWHSRSESDKKSENEPKTLASENVPNKKAVDAAEAKIAEPAAQSP